MQRRVVAMLAAAIVLLSGVRGVLAQSLTDGPLASPGDQTPVAPGAKPKSRRKATKTTHHRAIPVDEANVPVAPGARAPAPPPGTPLPDDPVDFGMKWNGSNDSATQTRVQNYNGTAQGTGAEVGMKLHF